MPGSLELLHFNPLTFCFAFAVFSSLLLILSAKVWKPVLKALDDRDDAIRGEMDRANESKLEAEKLLAEQKLAMNQLREEGRCMREEAMSLAEKQKAELLATAQHEAEQLAAGEAKWGAKKLFGRVELRGPLAILKGKKPLEARDLRLYDKCFF